MATIHTCIVDKKKYSYCPKCGSDNPNEKWRFLYCSEKCRTIFNTVKDFKNNKISKIEANAQIKELGEIDMDSLTDDLRTSVNIIIENKIETPKKQKRKNKNVVNEEIVNDIITEENKIGVENTESENVFPLDDFDFNSIL